MKRPKWLSYPLIVKSVDEEASLGYLPSLDRRGRRKRSERVAFIHNRVDSGALIERSIEGRELYVGIIGDGQLQVLPVWELIMDKLLDDAKRIATERVKWSRKYQQKYGVTSREAGDLPEGKAQEIQDLAKRVYRGLELSGYARIDMRMDVEGRPYVLESNPIHRSRRAKISPIRQKRLATTTKNCCKNSSISGSAGDLPKRRAISTKLDHRTLCHGGAHASTAAWAPCPSKSAVTFRLFPCAFPLSMK